MMINKNYIYHHQRMLNQTKIILGLIFVLAVVLRIWFVSKDNVVFWFDQSRDAVIASSIIKNRDLKIQGPSASGTSDSVFHGVLYYYLIAPLYYLGGGSPQVVSYGLAVLSSLSVIVVYLITKDILGKEKIALLSALLVAISALGVQEGVWLSNPVIMTVVAPMFFWLIWKVFFLDQKKYIYWLMFFLGINNQAAIFTITLFGVLGAAYFYRIQQEKKLLLFSFKEYFLSGIVYLLTISTMIVTEALMFKRGILTFDLLNKANEHLIKGSEVLFSIANLYLDLFLRVFSPTNLALVFIPFVMIALMGFLKLNKHKKIFFLIVILSPLWLLTWHYRTSFYAFIGFGSLLYLFLVNGLWELKKLFKGKWIFNFLIICFAVTNLWSLRNARANRVHLFGVQRGASLADQISLLEKTYQLANEQQFSISTLTVPYGVNVTWGYLYNQYGLKKYGFLPKFFGPSQTGWVGENLLEETNSTLENHFTIIEPDVGLSGSIRKQFMLDQTTFSSSPAATYKFGSLTLEQRKTKLVME